jgi:hypothetical protein
MTRICLILLSLPSAGCVQGVLTNPATGSGSTGSSMTGSSGGEGSSSGGGGTTTGGCAAPAGMSCGTSKDCCGANPCCQMLNTPACGVLPTGYPYYCLCSRTTECLAIVGPDDEDAECVPRAYMSGPITGPYVCVTNEGEAFGGCRGGVTCEVRDQYCSTDTAGNEFCSVACTSDSSCHNLGVACCNAACQDGGKCCGLCPDAG